MSKKALKSALGSLSVIFRPSDTTVQYRIPSICSCVDISPPVHGLNISMKLSKNTAVDAMPSGTHSSIAEKYVD